MHVLRSCSIMYKDTNAYPPCLIVSTLFTIPSPLNSFSYTVYNLHPLPVVVNQNKYIYTNIPTT
ncbi:unnamed protein product, partial [Rotaria sp. Silwood1]